MKKFVAALAGLFVAAGLFLACPFEAPEARGGGGENIFGTPFTLKDGKTTLQLNVENQPARSARTMSQAGAQSFIDYYEVFFKNTSDSTVTVGTAREGRPLRVSVLPGETYHVLLLGGIYDYRVLLASAWTGNVTIHEGQANTVTLTLHYAESNPTVDFSFNADDDTALNDHPARTAIENGIYHISTAAPNNAGSNYSVGDTFTYTPPGGGTPAVLAVAALSGSAIQSFTISNPGALYGDIASPTGMNLHASPWSYTASTGTPGTGATANITTASSSNVPNTVIPWFTYEKSGLATRSRDLDFSIVTKGLSALADAEGGSSITFDRRQLLLKVNKATDAIFEPLLASGTVSYSAGNITTLYSFARAGLPLVDSYGRLYFNIDYYPFGNPGNGHKWSIRNGLLYSLDVNTVASGGVLVVIGHPARYTAAGPMDFEVTF